MKGSFWLGHVIICLSISFYLYQFLIYYLNLIKYEDLTSIKWYINFYIINKNRYSKILIISLNSNNYFYF